MEKIPPGISLVAWVNMPRWKRRLYSSLTKRVGSSDERAFRKRVAKRRKKKGYK